MSTDLVLVIGAERADCPEAVALVAELDATLEPLYPPESQHGLDINALLAPHITFLVARQDGQAVGCGGLKQFADYGEISRLYVRPSARGHGVASEILHALEACALAKGIGVMRLEVGNRQPEALELYRSAGYAVRAPFGDYSAHPNCVFMEKTLA